MSDETRPVSAESEALCKHGIPLVARVGGPSSYCAACDDAFAQNPRYYADGLHLSSTGCPTCGGNELAAFGRSVWCNECDWIDPPESVTPPGEYCEQAEWPVVPCQQSCVEKWEHHHHGESGVRWTSPGATCLTPPGGSS